MKKSILFLGYDNSQTILINELLKKDCNVSYSRNIIRTLENHDLVISFGYRHIIKKELLNNTKIPIINLHISYLPWNRGAHPNFWAFFDSTPTGVSIHLVDKGIDTGPIIAQKMVNFDTKNMNFKQTYLILKYEVEKLFLENIDQIINKTFKAIAQKNKGSYHSISDLPKSFLGWEKNIDREIIRLRQLVDNK